MSYSYYLGIAATLVVFGCGSRARSQEDTVGVPSTDVAISTLALHLDSARNQVEPRDSNPYVVERRWFGGRLAVDIMSAERNMIDAQPVFIVASVAGQRPVVIDNQNDAGRLLAIWWPVGGAELLELCELLGRRFLVPQEVQHDVVAVRRAGVVPSAAMVSSLAALDRLHAASWGTSTSDSMSVRAWYVHGWYSTRADCSVSRTQDKGSIFSMKRLDTLSAVGFVGPGG